MQFCGTVGFRTPHGPYDGILINFHPSLSYIRDSMLQISYDIGLLGCLFVVTLHRTFLSSFTFPNSFLFWNIDPDAMNHVSDNAPTTFPDERSPTAFPNDRPRQLVYDRRSTAGFWVVTVIGDCVRKNLASGYPYMLGRIIETY